MIINFLGHSSFKLRGNDATLVTDPFSEDSVGLKFPKTEADIITSSDEEFKLNNFSQITGTPIVFNRPGEYEVKGVKITVIEIKSPDSIENRKKIIFKIVMDKMTIVHCGSLNRSFTDEEMELFEDISILMLPVGGGKVIGSKVASEITAKIEPKIVIPMYYRLPEYNLNNFPNIEDVSNFLKEMGKENITPLDRLTVKKASLNEEMTVVLLKP